MLSKKRVLFATVMRMLLIYSLAIVCLPVVVSHAQDQKSAQVFTGKDSWKNQYVKRSQEGKNVNLNSTGNERVSQQQVDEFTIKPRHKQTAASEEDDSELNLVREYVQPFVTVLAPKSVADIFGRRIAKRYVAFQITIANSNKEYQFLLQDVSIDMADVADLDSVTVPSNYKPSSNDITLLRGVSEKGQTYDWRNLGLRIIRGVGSLAAGLIGVTTFGSSYAPGVAVFNGPFVTSFRDVFPDLTVTQLNRLNDAAYQTNTLISKQSSKVIVAFIDQAMLMDKGLRKRFYNDPMSIADIIDFRKAVAEVSGRFITDVLDQPPFISAIVIDDDQKNHFLDKPASVAGRVIGKNLTGAKIQLENGPQGVDVKVAGVPESNRLNFTLTSTNPILPGSVLNFVIVKNSDVSKLSFPVSYTIAVPMLDSVAPNKLKQGDAGKEITLKGKDFIQSVFSVDACEKIKVKQATWSSPTEIKLKVDVPADAAVGGCQIRVKNGNDFISGPQVLTIEKAANQ